MVTAFQSPHPLKVIVVSLICFVIGGFWYSPLLFVKTWLKEMKITPEMIKARGPGPGHQMPAAFPFTIMSTYAMAALVAAHDPAGALKGAGIVAARSAVNGVFEGRTLRHYMISTGHDAVVCIAQRNPRRVALKP